MRWQVVDPRQDRPGQWSCQPRHPGRFWQEQMCMLKWWGDILVARAFSWHRMGSWCWLCSTVGVVGPRTVSNGRWWWKMYHDSLLIQWVFDKRRHTYAHMLVGLHAHFRWNSHYKYIFHWHFISVSWKLSAFDSGHFISIHVFHLLNNELICECGIIVCHDAWLKYPTIANQLNMLKRCHLQPNELPYQMCDK